MPIKFGVFANPDGSCDKKLYDQTSHNGHKKLVSVERWPSQRVLNKSQCMDGLPKKVAVVKWWPL